MIRIVVLVLAAANLLFFGWSRWVADQTPRLVAPDAPTAATRTVAAPAPAEACASIGPLDDEVRAMEVEQMLRDLQLSPVRRTVTVDEPDGWWVYVETADARAQARALRAIQGAGSGDAFAMPDDPQYRVSAGLFSDQARAEVRAAALRALQLAPVVAERMRQQSRFWFELPGTAPASVELSRLAAEGIDVTALQVRECEPGGEVSIDTLLPPAAD